MTVRSLANKIAVITGANSGIGLATAQRFVAAGSTVIAFDREVDRAENFAHSFRGDVTDMEDLDVFFNQVLQQFGRVDVLFANAGIDRLYAADRVSEQTYDAMFAVNARGVFFTVQKALPLMSPHGSIILTGSIAGVKGMPGNSVYCATKAAVRSFARSFAEELKDRHIRVNCLSPGYIDTPIFDTLGLTAPQVQAMKDGLVAATPLGRAGHADEIAAAAQFLASSDSSFVNGAELFVDGGMVQV